jgi:hypothetical protein
MRYIYKKNLERIRSVHIIHPLQKKIKKIVRFYEIVIVGDQV